MSPDDPSVAPTYDVGSSTVAPKKEPLQDRILRETEESGTEAQSAPYGVAKPKRITIRAKITND